MAGLRSFVEVPIRVGAVSVGRSRRRLVSLRHVWDFPRGLAPSGRYPGPPEPLTRDCRAGYSPPLSTEYRSSCDRGGPPGVTASTGADQRGLVRTRPGGLVMTITDDDPLGAPTASSRGAPFPPGSDVDTEEVRLALVMNGGVSLAVWMGGVTQEINRLVRGESVYGEIQSLLLQSARVDVISGASAGGLNGRVRGRFPNHPSGG
jgi:hypothetical protein